MVQERITDEIKSIGQSRVDGLVADYRRLESVSKVLRTQVPFEPGDLVEVARQTGRLTEEEIQEYLQRTQQPQE